MQQTPNPLNPKQSKVAESPKDSTKPCTQNYTSRTLITKSESGVLIRPITTCASTRVCSHLASGGAAPGLPRLGGEASGRAVHDCGRRRGDRGCGRRELWVVRKNGGGGEFASFLSCGGGKDARRRGGGGRVDFRDSAGETNGGCAAALEASTRV